MTDPRRRIPSVDALLASPPFAPLQEAWSRERVAEVVRREQASLREELSAGAGAAAYPLEDPAWHADRVRARLERAARRSLRPVINATGVVLHTNLGRAPLAAAARAAVAEAAGYGTLEYDVEAGSRGSRYDHCAGLLRELTGAEAALVVNNNAAAVVLALNALAEGRGVVISRGELVEIGGSFRVPEIMARSGARMVEVGSTNRTHRRDYAEALEADPAVILKVHRSNFRVEGFTAEVPAESLAELARGAGIPFVHDLGSGALLDMTALGLPPEPTAREALEAGADVVTLSGDKLLGGPQAGIILGRADLVERMRTSPLCRAFRCDKLTLAALEATLALYRDDDPVRTIPALRMLAATPAALRERADALARRLADGGASVEVVEAPAAVGGGAYPGVELPGWAVALTAPGGAEALAARLRAGEPPVVGRIREGRVLLHPRTVAESDVDALVDGVRRALGPGGGAGSPGASGRDTTE